MSDDPLARDDLFDHHRKVVAGTIIAEIAERRRRAEDERRERAAKATAERMAQTSEKAIRREWAAFGVDPASVSGYLVSPSLARQLGRFPRSNRGENR